MFDIRDFAGFDEDLHKYADAEGRLPGEDDFPHNMTYICCDFPNEHAWDAWVADCLGTIAMVSEAMAQAGVLIPHELPGPDLACMDEKTRRRYERWDYEDPTEDESSQLLLG